MALLAVIVLNTGLKYKVKKVLHEIYPEKFLYSEYYQNNVKPKPQTEGKKGYVCKICGYVYEGDTLPEDYICPLCKHGAADFDPIA